MGFSKFSPDTSTLYHTYREWVYDPLSPVSWINMNGEENWKSKHGSELFNNELFFWIQIHLNLNRSICWSLNFEKLALIRHWIWQYPANCPVHTTTTRTLITDQTWSYRKMSELSGMSVGYLRTFTDIYGHVREIYGQKKDSKFRKCECDEFRSFSDRFSVNSDLKWNQNSSWDSVWSLQSFLLE